MPTRFLFSAFDAEFVSLFRSLLSFGSQEKGKRGSLSLSLSLGLFLLALPLLLRFAAFLFLSSFFLSLEKKKNLSPNTPSPPRHLSLSLSLPPSSLLGGAPAPEHGQARAPERHEHDRDRRGHRDERVREVRLREQEAERRRLHAGLDRDRARGLLAEAEALGQEVAERERGRVQQRHGQAQIEPLLLQDARDLRARRRAEQRRERDADERQERAQLADDLGEALVGEHAQQRRDEHDLEGREREPGRVDGDQRAREHLGQQRRHHDRAERRRRRHQHRQRDVAVRDVGGDVRGLPTGAARHEDEADGERRGQVEHAGDEGAEERLDDVLGKVADADLFRVFFFFVSGFAGFVFFPKNEKDQKGGLVGCAERRGAERGRFRGGEKGCGSLGGGKRAKEGG